MKPVDKLDEGSGWFESSLAQMPKFWVSFGAAYSFNSDTLYKLKQHLIEDN